MFVFPGSVWYFCIYYLPLPFNSREKLKYLMILLMILLAVHVHALQQ